MQVNAAPGHKVPIETDPQTYIESEPVEVPDTSYYRRRIAAGELRLADKKRSGAKDPAQEPAK